jgi:hypothetical protein
MSFGPHSRRILYLILLTRKHDLLSYVLPVCETSLWCICSIANEHIKTLWRRLAVNGGEETARETGEGRRVEQVVSYVVAFIRSA